MNMKYSSCKIYITSLLLLVVQIHLSVKILKHTTFPVQLGKQSTINWQISLLQILLYLYKNLLQQRLKKCVIRYYLYCVCLETMSKVTAPSPTPFISMCTEFSFAFRVPPTHVPYDNHILCTSASLSARPISFVL